MATSTRKAAPTKKVTAKKVTPPPAKRTVRKVAAPKVAPSTPEPDPYAEIVDVVVDAVKKGYIDTALPELEDAIIARFMVIDNVANPTAVKTTTTATKKAAPAPKRGAGAVTAVTPVVGKTYVINAKVKSIGGARVKFLRYKEGDENRSVVEFLTAAGSYDKGKQVAIPTSALGIVTRTLRK